MVSTVGICVRELEGSASLSVAPLERENGDETVARNEMECDSNTKNLKDGQPILIRKVKLKKGKM